MRIENLSRNVRNIYHVLLRLKSLDKDIRIPILQEILSYSVTEHYTYIVEITEGGL